jgi:hypothetical protein
VGMIRKFQEVTLTGCFSEKMVALYILLSISTIHEDVSVAC